MAALSDYGKDASNPEMLKALVGGELLVRNNLLPADTDQFSRIADNGLVTDDSLAGSIGQYSEDLNQIVSQLDERIAAGQQVSGDDITSEITSAQAKLGSSFRFVTSGAADNWRCGVTRDNNVFCWGLNGGAVLGDPVLYETTVKKAGKNLWDGGWDVVDNYSASPVAVQIKTGEDSEGNPVYAPLSNVSKVSVGGGHACAVTYSGEVWCWGQNYHGQLGIAEEVSGGADGNVISPYAQRVLRGQQDGDYEYLSNISDVALVRNASCALSRDGEVFCWGDNTAVTAGVRYVAGYSRNYFTRVTNGSDIEMASGKGGLACDPEDESCEPEFIQDIHVPVKVPFPKGVARVKSLASGSWSYCAIAENTSAQDRPNLYCWGKDILGMISRDKSKHLAEFQQKFLGKHRDSKGENVYTLHEPWYWSIYEESGDYYPLFGEPVTQISDYGVFSTQYQFQRFQTPEEQQSFIDSCRKDGAGYGFGYCEVLDSGEDSWDNYDEYTVYISNWDVDFSFTTQAERDAWEENCTSSEEVMEKSCYVTGTWVESNDGGYDEDGNPIGETIYRLSASIQTPFKSEDERDAYSQKCQEGAEPGMVGCYAYDWSHDVEELVGTETGYYVDYYVKSKKYTADITDVSNVALANQDGNLLLQYSPDHALWDPESPAQKGIYKVWGDAIWHQVSTGSGDLISEKIASIYPSKDGDHLLLLTKSGHLYYEGLSIYGLPGRGYQFTDNNDYIRGFVLDPDGEEILEDVIGVSFNNRSICAITQRRVADETGTDLSGEEVVYDKLKRDLYCWGSSTFGQLGFDNGAGGFSANDINALWNNIDNHNELYDDPSRYEISPVEVTGIMFGNNQEDESETGNDAE